MSANKLWISVHSRGERHTVRYGSHCLATFVRHDIAVAYRDWFWARRDWYLADTRLGRFTMEDLIRARKV